MSPVMEPVDAGSIQHTRNSAGALGYIGLGFACESKWAGVERARPFCMGAVTCCTVRRRIDAMPC
jgi:hypothetical protein